MGGLRMFQKLGIRLLIHAAPLVQIGHRDAGIHAINAHTFGRQLESHAACKLINSHLRDVVCQHTRERSDAVHARHVNDVALRGN
uniref:Putative secreted protein n=1 Tax=Anopheles darlingi TaxID=43151 RepID=A0A2M4D2Y1_ANODA